MRRKTGCCAAKSLSRPGGLCAWLSGKLRMSPAPWVVPVAVDDVPEEGGQRFDLVADAMTRAAVARIAGLRELPRLEANFEVTRFGVGGLRVAGRGVGDGRTDLRRDARTSHRRSGGGNRSRFAPPVAAARQAEEAGPADEAANETEPLIDGTIDLGVLATEFLILGIDPYPRKPDAVFQPPQDAEPRRAPSRRSRRSRRTTRGAAMTAKRSCFRAANRYSPPGLATSVSFRS